ncbi:MAG TPA: FAD-dependent oxidoreductase [Solirubrobacteraceae bacterium]
MTPARDHIATGSPRPMLDDDDPALFPKLTDRQLELLMPLGEIRPIAAGEVLFRDGDRFQDPMVLLEGSVQVVLSRGGEQNQVVTQRPRDLMAELNVFTGQRNAASAVVVESGSVLVIAAREFRALLGRELEFGDFVFQTMFRRRRAIERLRLGIKIVGPASNPDTVRLREFASRNRILSQWIDPGDPAADGIVGHAAMRARSVPVVVLGDRQSIVNPTNERLVAAIGLRTAPISPDGVYDLAVIGAGPAGLAAAVYGSSGGLRTAVVDAVAVGGQAATSARIENYLGFPAGVSGAELAERAAFQARKFRARIIVPCEAIRLGERDDLYEVGLDGGDRLRARVVILAIGVQYRRLPIPNLVDYEGVGVTYATDSARQQLRPGDGAVVVGGANSAGQTALSLASEGRTVHLVVRAEALERGMARYLRDRIAAEPLIAVRLQHRVAEVGGDDRLERVVIEDAVTGARESIAAGAMVVLIGAEPRTDWLGGQIALDEHGFVLAGPALGPDAVLEEPWSSLGRGPLMLETSRPGVFAVGDIRSGATRMVAPAVGEGGMAVRLAHEHLAHRDLRSRAATA